jgi:hypothetical protein
VTDILAGIPCTPNGLDGLHGAYTYRFARAALGEYRLRNAVETGELVGFGRGVLLDARRVLDLRTRCAGALLLTDGVIAGPTAVALHGCCAAAAFPVHVWAPYDRRLRSRGGLVVHQSKAPYRDVTVVDGLRVLAPDVALAELVCTATRRTALACLDQALRAVRVDDRPGFVDQIAERVAARADRRGTRQAGIVLALATGLPETPAQSTLLLVLRDAGLPVPACQYPVRDRSGRVIHRLDFAWPESRVAVEVTDPGDGDDHRVATRCGQLRAVGWSVVPADVDDLADPVELCRRLRTALDQRRAA